MKFLIVDPEKKNPFVAERLMLEEQEVALLSTPEALGRYNLCKTLLSPGEVEFYSPDIVLFTSPGLGKFAYGLYSRGIKVVGSSLIHDTFHEDPNYATVLASRIHVPICPIDNHGPKIRLAGLYSKKKWIRPGLAFCTHSGLLETNRVGNMIEGVVLRRIPDNSKLATETFVKLERMLTAVDFSGWIFLDVELDPDGCPHIHRLSVENPDGFWPAFLEGLKQPLYRVLEGVASTRKGFTFQFAEQLVGAVKVSLPPYPANRQSSPSDRELLEHLVFAPYRGVELEGSHYWTGVYLNGGSAPKSDSPELGWVADSSDSLQDLSYQLRTTAAAVHPESQFRHNIGLELGESLLAFSSTVEES